MRKVQSAIAMLAVALFLGGAGPATAQFYTQHNLVSDGAAPADLVDTSLVNAWGLAASSSSPWWVSNNGTDSSTLYNGNTGAKVVLGIFDPLCGCVHVPGAPTGIVFNGTPFTTGLGFVVSDPAAVPPINGPARFIFDAEDGSISGWAGGDHAIVAVPPSEDAVYKGLAIVSTIPGDVAGDFLYATNFKAGTVDVFDSTFVKQPPGQFADPTIPADYAPFGIQTIGDVVYVTYALRGEEEEEGEGLDDVPGMGHGFVSAFDLAGNFIRRVASGGPLNSPWGLARAPDEFGKFSNDLLVGNFGNGRINAYDPDDLLDNGEYEHRGMMHSTGGPPLEIEGLWALQFGNGGSAGPTTTLFFTAGPDEESHGLFGSLVQANPPGKN